MTNDERLAKIDQAEKLIREVEFSYEYGHSMRQRLYKVVVDTFSLMGSLSPIKTQIKLDIIAEMRKAAQAIDSD